MTERIDQLTGPPVPGRFYLVPTVRYRLNGIGADWPVIGPKHADREFFHFVWDHYHVDGRFLGESLRKRLRQRTYDWLGVIQRTPLCRFEGISRAMVLHPEPVWRPRRCVDAGTPYLFGHMHPVQALRAAFAGDRLRRDAAGRLICPHRGADLTTIPPDERGVITCPLHGLRFCAATGEASQ